MLNWKKQIAVALSLMCASVAYADDRELAQSIREAQGALEIDISSTPVRCIGEYFDTDLPLHRRWINTDLSLMLEGSQGKIQQLLSGIDESDASRAAVKYADFAKDYSRYYRKLNQIFSVRADSSCQILRNEGLRNTLMAVKAFGELLMARMTPFAEHALGVAEQSSALYMSYRPEMNRLQAQGSEGIISRRYTELFQLSAQAVALENEYAHAAHLTVQAKGLVANDAVRLLGLEELLP